MQQKGEKPSAAKPSRHTQTHRPLVYPCIDENVGVDGWIILGWISRRWDVGMWTGLGWPRIERGGGRL